MLKGVDLSKWNGTSAVDNAGDFVICKATEGVGYVDRTCDIKYQRAKTLGKLRGVYHFARPDLGNSSTNEAQYFVDNIKGYIGDAILVLDWEKSTSNVSWAKEWLDEVYRLTGIRPLIYMNASVVNSNNWSSISSNYGLWIAGYPNKYNVKFPPTPGPSNMPYSIGSWKFWAIWQYSSSTGSLDLDIANMDKEAWSKYAAKPIPQQTNTPQEPEQTQPLPSEENDNQEVNDDPIVAPTIPEEKPKEESSWLLDLIKKIGEFLVGLFIKNK